MPNLEDLLKQIESQRGVVTGLGEKTAGATTGFEYGEAIRERLKPDEELIKSIAAARSKMLAIPSEVRARQKPGWVTPSQTAGIISAEQEPLRTSWETQMQLREAKKGRTEDTIKRVTEMINKDIEKQESRYDQEREKLEDLITERDWVTSQQQFQEEMELKRAQEARLSREDGPTGLAKDYFTDTQLAKGATAARMSIDEFGNLSRDEANEYIYGTPENIISPEDIEDTKADIQKRYDSRERTKEQLKEMILETLKESNASNTIDVETELLNYIDKLGHVGIGQEILRRLPGAAATEGRMKPQTKLEEFWRKMPFVE